MRTLIYNDKRIGGQCKNCPDRKIEPVNCHSYCEKYLNAQKEWLEYKHSMFEKYKADYEYDVYKSKRVGETKKWLKSHKPQIKPK